MAMKRCEAPEIRPPLVQKIYLDEPISIVMNHRDRKTFLTDQMILPLNDQNSKVQEQ